MKIRSEYSLEVRYYETDKMGIVHHSNYVRYLECGRHKMLEEIGVPVTAIEASGIMLPVVSVEVNYRTPARMGDLLRIVSRVEKEPMAKIEVLADIYNQKDEKICDGKVVIGFIHEHNRRPTRVPEFVLEAMKKASED